MVTRKVTIETIHPPCPIYATDTYILYYTFFVRSHSAKSSLNDIVFKKANINRIGIPNSNEDKIKFKIIKNVMTNQPRHCAEKIIAFEYSNF